jgi:hypothetical protein
MASTSLVATIVPGLQSQTETTAGLSDNSKKIVIGVVVGIGGAAVLALIGVIIWRHMKKESDSKPSMSNVAYFSDDDPRGAYGAAPTEGVIGIPYQATYNNAANF